MFIREANQITMNNKHFDHRNQLEAKYNHKEKYQEMLNSRKNNQSGLGVSKNAKYLSNNQIRRKRYFQQLRSKQFNQFNSNYSQSLNQIRQKMNNSKPQGELLTNNELANQQFYMENSSVIRFENGGNILQGYSTGAFDTHRISSKLNVNPKSLQVDGDGLRSSHWKDDDTHQQQHQHCKPLIKGDKRKYYINHRYSRRKICQAQSSFKTKLNQQSSFTGLDSISSLLKLNSYPTSLYDGQDLSLEFDSIIETQSLNEQKCCQKQFTANQKDWSGRDSKYMAVDQIAIQDQRQVLKQQNQQNYFQQNRVGNQISRKLRSKNDISKQHKVQMYQRSKVDMLKLNSKYQQKSRQNKHGEAPRNDNKTNSSEFLQITANDCKLITTRQLSQRLNAEQVVCQSQPVNYKDKTQDLKNHEPHRSDQIHNKRKRWHKKRSQKQHKNFQGYKGQHSHQDITKGIRKQKYIKKSQFKKAKGQLKKFALLGKRHNAPLNTTQFIINDMEDRQVSQNQENHMISHWPLNKACFEEDKDYEFQSLSQSNLLFTNQNNRDSQISTTTGDVSEEESLARNEIHLMNEPGLSMEGFINDDMFEINLSEAEDFLYNEKTDNQMEFLQQNQNQQLEIDLESCDEDDLMKKLKSNQILIEALQKEAALKRNSCELFNQCR